MEIRYGIIAVAGISSRFVGAVKASGGNVTAAASRSLAKARQFCNEHQIPRAYGSYEELYQDPDITVVYIATVNAAHAAESRRALSCGKHVLCEKPLCLKAGAAKELFRLAKSRGLFLMEMQKSIFLPVTQLVKDYIDNGRLGALHQIDMNAMFEAPAAAWMHEAAQGGVVYGSASYTLEYLDYLLNPEQTQIQALGTKELLEVSEVPELPEPSGPDNPAASLEGAVDAVSLNIRMDDILISSRISMKAAGDSFAVFYFEQGCIKVPDYWKARTCQITTAGETENHEFPVDFEMIYEMEHAELCLGQGLAESPVMAAARTVSCCRWVEYIMESLAANR